MKNLKIENLNLQILLEIHKSLNLHYDMHRVLNLIMDFAIELTQAERGFLILEKGGHLEYKVARTAEKKPIDSPESEVSRSIIHTVLTQKTSLIAHDAKDQKQFEDSVSINDLQLRSVICIPLTHKEKILGVLYLDNRQKKEVFSTIDLDLLIAFSHFSGVALGRALLYEQLRKKNQELVHSKRRLENLNQELELLNQKLEKKWKVEEQVLNEATQNLMQQESASAFKELVGVSEPMRHVFNLLKKVIDSSVPVFILGETGTGKEQIARILHQYGPRSPFPFYAENCSSTDKHFLENEFFGHEKGAFTHAQTQRAGLFELAHQGTLFLDEISEMPLDLQKKLLRVLQEEKIRRVGGHEEIPIDVRILCASKHDLRPLIAQGKFREDLYYRIHVIQIQLPPLRERQEDIYLLA
jgi:transcriptional regulator with GAF, ATPase, and Fis domain